jgi:hypothetical protein
MHALLVTFQPEAPEAEIMPVLGPRMKETASTTPGLIMKTFVDAKPNRWGAFYLFATRDDAEAYLSGDFYQWFSTSELLSGFDVRHFEVDDEPSILFGTPTTPLAVRMTA